MRWLKNKSGLWKVSLGNSGAAFTSPLHKTIFCKFSLQWSDRNLPATMLVPTLQHEKIELQKVSGKESLPSNSVTNLRQRGHLQIHC